jgi:hypothetical protein
MTVEHNEKPLIYWVAGKTGVKHEIPEGATICIFDKKQRCYREVWIDQKTGIVQVREGGPK